MKRYSIRNRLFFTMMSISVPVMIILLLMCSYTKHRMRTEIAESYKTTLKNQVAYLEERVKEEENFLLNLFQSDMNMLYLRKDPESPDRANYLYNIKKKFDDRHTESGLCEWYFVLMEDFKYSVLSEMSRADYEERASVEAYLREIPLSEEAKNISWELIQIDGKWYYLRALVRNRICIGSLLEASTVLEKIGMSENENAKMLLLGEKEEITENGDWAEEKQIQISKEENSIYRMVGEKKKYLLITEPFQKLTGKAAYVISDQEILGGMAGLLNIMRGMAVLIFFAFSGTALAVYRIWMVPMGRLKRVMHDIRDGRTSKPNQEEERVSQEFGEVYDQFEEMMEALQTWKVKSYEEELQKKNYQLQFYFLQLKPHFYLNSLKCLYGLAQKEDYRKIQEMLLSLSDYFKYITYDSQRLITLEDEIRHTAMYVEVRQMGVMDPIECEVDIDSRARKQKVLGLVVQTFVENSIKYGRKSGQNLKVEIKVTMLEQENRKYMSIIVQDNGEGYNKEIIRQVNREDKDSWNGHVGLLNLRNRLKLVYGEHAFLAISNLPEGGAYSEVVFLVKEEEEIESIDCR